MFACCCFFCASVCTLAGNDLDSCAATKPISVFTINTASSSPFGGGGCCVCVGFLSFFLILSQLDHHHHHHHQHASLSYSASPPIYPSQPHQPYTHTNTSRRRRRRRRRRETCGPTPMHSTVLWSVEGYCVYICCCCCCSDWGLGPQFSVCVLIEDPSIIQPKTSRRSIRSLWLVA